MQDICCSIEPTCILLNSFRGLIGMFVWLKLLNGITDSNQLITSVAVEKKVLAVPGVVSSNILFVEAWDALDTGYSFRGSM